VSPFLQKKSARGKELCKKYYLLLSKKEKPSRKENLQKSFL